MEIKTAVTSLVVITVATSFCADICELHPVCTFYTGETDSVSGGWRWQW